MSCLNGARSENPPENFTLIAALETEALNWLKEETAMKLEKGHKN